MRSEHWRNKLRFGRSDLFTFLLSVITGVMIWIYVDSRRTEERSVKAALEIGIPPGWKIDDKPPEFVRVSLRGPRTVMGTLKPEEVRFYRALELPPGAAANQEVHFELTRDDLRGLPRDVSVVEIPESSVKMRLVRPVRRYVPVEVQKKGELAKGYLVKSITFSPEYVAVYAAAEEFSGADTARTLPVNLAEKTESFGTYVDLEPLKLKRNNIVLEDPVFVQVEVVEKTEQVKIEKIPVGILLATPLEKLAGGKIIPSQVSLVLEGGAQTMSTLTSNSVSVYIDTKEMGSSVQGEYTLRCRAQAPAGVKVVKIIPDEVRWVIPASVSAGTLPAPERLRLIPLPEAGPDTAPAPATRSAPRGEVPPPAPAPAATAMPAPLPVPAASSAPAASTATTATTESTTATPTAAAAATSAATPASGTPPAAPPATPVGSGASAVPAGALKGGRP